MKYCMVAINRKLTEDNEVLTRRVLISFEKFRFYKNEFPKRRVYSGTRIVEKDPYFYDKDRSHQYKFTDDGFTLIKSDEKDDTLINKKRRYHCTSFCPGIIFEADTDEEAIKKFNEREELK